MKMNFAPLALGICLAGLFVAPANALDRPQNQVLIEARIIEVSTGDTMKGLADNGIRDLHLFGVNCPPPDQPFGPDALKFTSDQISGREVKIEVHPTADGQGVLCNIILPDGKDLVGELLRRGLAGWNHLQSPDPQLGALETQARSEGLGIWSSPDSVPVLRLLVRPEVQDSNVRLNALAESIIRLSDGERAELARRVGQDFPVQHFESFSTFTYSDRPQVIIQSPRIIDRPHRHDSPDGMEFRDGSNRRDHGERDEESPSHSQTTTFGRPSSGAGQGGNTQDQIVYVDSSGRMFHRASCFGKNPLGTPMSRSQAVAGGLAACPKCNP